MSSQIPLEFSLLNVLDVLRAVEFSAAYWKALGGRLKPDLDLDAIEANYHKVEDRLEKVIDGWQRDGDNPSWETLAKAVSQCTDVGGGKNVGRHILQHVGLLEPQPQLSERVRTGIQQEENGMNSCIPNSTPHEEHTTSHELTHQENADSALGSDGRPSTSSPFSPYSSFEWSSNKQLSTDMLSEDEVKKRKSDLTSCFQELVIDTQDALEDSQAPPQKIVRLLLLPDPDFKNRDEHKDILDRLKKETKVDDLFCSLNDYWDHFNYHLLEKLLTPPGIKRLVADTKIFDGLNDRMMHFIKDMEDFRTHTPLDVYCKVGVGRRVPVPEGFRLLVTKHQSSEMRTLQDVENFRQKIAFEYQLSKCLVFVENIRYGCVEITLSVPVDIPDPLPEAEDKVEIENEAESKNNAFVDVGELGTSVDLEVPNLGTSVDLEAEPGTSIHLGTEPPTFGTTVDLEAPEFGTSVDLGAENPELGSSVDLPQDQETPSVRAVQEQSPITEKAVRTQEPRKPVSLTEVAIKLVSRELYRPVKKLKRYAAQTPLIRAVKNQDSRRVSELIASGTNINPDTDWTPLKEASSTGNTEIALKLLKSGADPNLVTDNWTPLMEASRVGNAEMAQFLIENGADPNVVNGENWTALMAACNNGRYNAVDVLLRNGAEPNMQDYTGWSALMAAVFQGHEHISLRLVEAGAVPDIQNSRGETALLLACKKKKLIVVKRLLKKGANPDLANKEGDLPLLKAIGEGEKEIVKELLEAEADPNLDCGLDLPLHHASSMGYKEIVELLISYGADPDRMDKYSTSLPRDLLQLATKAIRRN